MRRVIEWERLDQDEITTKVHQHQYVNSAFDQNNRTTISFCWCGAWPALVKALAEQGIPEDMSLDALLRASASHKRGD